MRFTVSETTSPDVQSTIEDHYVAWYSHVDQSPEWVTYASGLGAFTLPLIATIHPDDPNAYIDRSTNIQTPAFFFDRLTRVAADNPVTAASSIPTLGEWAAMLLALALGSAVLWRVRRSSH